MNIPEGYQHVMPYLIVKDAKGLLSFMQNVLGAKEKMIVNAEDGGIKHGEVFIGDSCVMFAQASDEWTPENAGMFVYVPDVDAAFQRALKAGGSEIMPPTDMDYGRSSGVKDPYGNTWWITSPL